MLMRRESVVTKFIQSAPKSRFSLKASECLTLITCSFINEQRIDSNFLWWWKSYSDTQVSKKTTEISEWPDKTSWIINVKVDELKQKYKEEASFYVAQWSSKLEIGCAQQNQERCLDLSEIGW